METNFSSPVLSLKNTKTAADLPYKGCGAFSFPWVFVPGREYLACLSPFRPDNEWRQSIGRVPPFLSPPDLALHAAFTEENGVFFGASRRQIVEHRSSLHQDTSEMHTTFFGA